MPQISWTDEMGPAPIADHLDAQARAATVAAFTFLDHAPRGSSPEERNQRPVWHIGTFASPGNQVAEEMTKVTLANVTATGLDQKKILACAVNLAIMAFDAGGGTEGWAAMAARLPKAVAARGKVIAARKG